MTDDFELAAKLVNELNELGSADEVAEILRAQGILGFPGVPDMCAVSEYVKKRTNIEDVVVDGMWVHLDMYNGSTNRVRINDVLRKFISCFDYHEYPYLVPVQFRKNENES